MQSAPLKLKQSTCIKETDWGRRCKGADMSQEQQKTKKATLNLTFGCAVQSDG